MHNNNYETKRGFTLIELLVVIGIIGILIAALVPQAKNAQIRAKEANVKMQAKSINDAIAAFAQNNNGLYPGVAVDPMAPYTDHGLGDNGADGSEPVYTKTPADQFDATPGSLVNGVLGGVGHRNMPSPTGNAADPVHEQLRVVKNTPLTANATQTARYFDALIASEAIQEYPPNPFLSTLTGERQRMRNIFSFRLDVSSGFDPATSFAGPTGGNYEVALNTAPGMGSGGTILPDNFGAMRLFLQQTPGGVPLANYVPEQFAAQSLYGIGEKYFSPGDFAYVPVLTMSDRTFGSATATPEDDRFKWATGVGGYMLFAYGHNGHKNREFDDAARDFAQTGLPGFGEEGIDTLYENYVLQLFEGAIYFHKSF